MKRIRWIVASLCICIFMCLAYVEDSWASERSLRAKTLEHFRIIVYNQMLERKDQIIIEYTGKDYKDIFKSFKEETFLDEIGKIDNPKTSDDFDYMVQNISYLKTGMKYGAASGAQFTIDIRWRESLEELKYVNAGVANILLSCNIESIESVYERVKVIHDYIVKNVEYDVSLKNENAYTALKYGSSTCQGYSLLFYKMLSEAGIKCRYITGTGISEKDTGPHGWNIVKIGDLWYNVDVTWDDPVYLNPNNKTSKISYDYFLEGSKDFDPSHKRDDKFITAEFLEKYPMSEMDFNKKNDMKISEIEEDIFVETTLPPEEIEEVPDSPIERVVQNISSFFEGLVGSKENFPEYIAKSFNELDARQKMIIILLIILVIGGNIGKLFACNKRRNRDDYEDDI